MGDGIEEQWGDEDAVVYVTAPPGLQREAEGYAAGLEASSGVAHHVVIRVDCPPGKMYVTAEAFDPVMAPGGTTGDRAAVVSD